MKRVRVSTAILVVTIMLCGCAAAVPIHSTPAPVTEKQDEIQSSRERELVILFQGLVQMDKKENLVISGRQAEYLLPLVMRKSSEGGLTQTDQNEMVAQLSGEQKQYVDDFQERSRSRIKAFKELKERANGLSHEERDNMIREFQTRRKHELDGDWPSPPPVPRNAEEAGAVQSGAPAGPAAPGSGGMNVEHQLIVLLESKIHKEAGK